MGNNHHSRRQFILGLTAAAGAAFPAAAKTPLSACPLNRVSITGAFGKAAFNVTVADTEETRAQGLMNVPSMPISTGMLFIYDRPQAMSFWMRNTLIELDMLFVDRFGVIQHIHHRAQPLDETVISPGDIKLTGVLEINGGLAKRLGIKAKDVLRHPSFTSLDKPWNCD
ncbi:DUF192 domain-containing protein [Sulfitobacter donghicola]|uniref:DUF192 domain-containing protein n=1 Tax=Sulfitobacter donghicola DSW-25 = KCTC 12864 = JCM 14565 TaxID=1300350 RepID=A0A073IIE4_9RHOB|nr:DUF192 domain-containing protein [Sulfitobacter donghicola]KEJ89514.1 hypothetical protein DSW25_10945 [Sulfitobacter donghicola DSW-25 = KCTC 12864 = JCM 14565]KIN69337.1 hypothetical protein Z948_3076 [Sulfitobacter donghicola DSW-25 = KCTC 12864 = JCM 14565]